MADVNAGLLVRIEALPGKEAGVEQFLQGGLDLVNEEPDTITWYAIRLGPTTFGDLRHLPGRLRPPGAPLWTGRRSTHG